MALSILVYHYADACFGRFPADTLLGRLGIYGVSAFYVISGVSLSIAYQGWLWDWGGVRRFFTRRVFRIAPLYWFAALLVVLFALMNAANFQPDWGRYLWNFSLLFGFYELRAYIPMGGWSIGNEMVFYAAFPLLMAATRWRWAFLLAIVVIFFWYAYFAFGPMFRFDSLVEGWLTYINPGNQGFLFAVGVALGMAASRIQNIPASVAWLVFGSALSLFVFYPVSGDQINLVRGWNRLFFTGLIVAICFSLIRMRGTATSIFGRVLRFFGDISYSIYLLHGAVMTYSLRYLSPFFDGSANDNKFTILFGLAIPITILLSAAVYRYIEQPMVRVGRRLSNNEKRA